jgi:hypothetical protein
MSRWLSDHEICPETIGFLQLSQLSLINSMLAMTQSSRSWSLLIFRPSWSPDLETLRTCYSVIFLRMAKALRITFLHSEYGQLGWTCSSKYSFSASFNASGRGLRTFWWSLSSQQSRIWPTKQQISMRRTSTTSMKSWMRKWIKHDGFDNRSMSTWRLAAGQT